MTEFVFGETLEARPGEVADLAKRVLNGQLLAAKVDPRPDGDLRYWDVDPGQSEVLQRLNEFATREYVAAVGKPPAKSFIMVNHIDARRSPSGSGGKWHRDSYSRQYKAFLYLVDVESPAQGAFCFIARSNNHILRAVTGAYLVLTKDRNYPDRLIRAFEKMGWKRKPVLAKAGVPFFVDTSLLHRGLAITEGIRIAATVYIFDEADAPLPYEGTGVM